MGLLPEARIVDSTDLMDRVRWIKTTGEVKALEAGARLLDEAYLEVLPTVRPGDTERLVHSRIIESCLRRGANWAHGILNSSRNAVAYGGESDMAFQAGDIIRNDYVSYLNGYPGHQSAPCSWSADRRAKEYLPYHSGHLPRRHRPLPSGREGVRHPTISPTTASTKRDSRATCRCRARGGRLWHQQEPYMVPSSDRVLEKGMVVALEPHIGYWHLQDMVLVTGDGPCLLSPLINTDEMLVAG